MPMIEIVEVTEDNLKTLAMESVVFEESLRQKLYQAKVISGRLWIRMDLEARNYQSLVISESLIADANFDVDKWVQLETTWS